MFLIYILERKSGIGAPKNDRQAAAATVKAA